MELACHLGFKKCPDFQAEHHLFKCDNPRFGHRIQWIEECMNGCENRGFGKNDRCKR
jgi:hypothetical protein